MAGIRLRLGKDCPRSAPGSLEGLVGWLVVLWCVSVCE